MSDKGAKRAYPSRPLHVLLGTKGDSGCHSYLQVTNDVYWDGRPLLFTFPANLGLQDWHFQPETEKGQGVEASMFVLPDGCESITCPKSSAHLRAEMPSWPHSYWAALKN